MNDSRPEQSPHSTSDADHLPVTPSDSAPPLTDDEQQAEYFAAYQIQLRRMSCPGCGEGELPI